ncbi:MAG: hypothetical protein K9W43_14260 [Candidatus Thorarchaeota archaeon]|nr:hypothetical protein [Candidatus Thorarchaeota archaeon]
MQGFADIFEFIWIHFGFATLQFGIPAVILFLISKIIEMPVYTLIQSQYLHDKYGIQKEPSAIIELPVYQINPSQYLHDKYVIQKKTSVSRFAQWCFSVYRKHQLFYDAAVDLSKLTSYVLTFLFMYAAGGDTAFGILVLLIPASYCVVRRPTIQLRTVADVEDMARDGLLPDSLEMAT